MDAGFFAQLLTPEMAMFAAALLATGVVAGVAAGLLGIGGGAIIVPVLFYLYGALDMAETHRMQLCIGTSLATIIFTSIASTRAHMSHGAVDRDLLWLLTPGVIIGVVIGSETAQILRSETLTAVFAAILLLIALKMLTPSNWSLRDSMPGKPISFVLGIIIGGLSSLMGIGGGSLSVPTMTACAVPIKRAVGTAAAIGLAIGLVGALDFAIGGLRVEAATPTSFGHVDLLAVAIIVPMTMKFAPKGAALAHKLDAAMLKKVFAVFLILISVKMIWSSIG